MPGDEDRSAKDNPQNAEGFDPLEQPPLVRKPQRSLTGEPGDSDGESAVAGAAGKGEASAGASSVIPRTKPRTGGRFLGLLGFLAGLAGLGVAGYLYYLFVFLNPQAALEDRLAQLQHRLETQTQALEEMRASQTGALAALAEEEQKARERTKREVLEAVNRIAAQAPPSRREWKVAEVAYLLRIANQRLLMEQDVDGAHQLLTAADAILAELDDFALYPVRAQLADEMLALENVESNDVQGLFLRLEAIKASLSRQPLKLPRVEQPVGAAAEPAEGGIWEAVLAQMDRYLRFRRFDGASRKPLLAPEEAVYLEMNLRLMLERAQLAALRRDQLVFEHSLATAAEWVATYMDTSNDAVQGSLDELEGLSAVVLDQPLPDISGSLRTLESLGEA